MDALYWASLVIGGVSVLASIFGGGDTDADADVDLDLDADADVDAAMDSGGGWVDWFSLRTVLLFAAFFGLCGVLLPLAGVSEPIRAVLSTVTGLAIGVTGNYVIRRVGYEHVSSVVSGQDLVGCTAKVLIPFDHTDRGKISLVGKGRRIQMIARSYEGEEETYAAGDEVVIVQVDKAVADVVKPD